MIIMKIEGLGSWVVVTFLFSVVVVVVVVVIFTVMLKRLKLLKLM